MTIAPLPWHLSPSNVWSVLCCNDCSWLLSHSKTLCSLPAVCLHSKQKYGGCYPDCDPCHFETSGEAKGLCPDALLGLLIGVQHNPASPADAEADGHGCQPHNHPLALQLPDRSSINLEVSSEVHTNTGAPERCVLSPVLFTLYTSDGWCTAKDVLQVKFSDDTSLTGLIRMSETSYCCAVDKLVGWCNNNHLLLNVSKMKERVVDFRRDPPTPRPLVINGEEVEIVGEYKYLGSIIDCKLEWSSNALALL